MCGSGAPSCGLFSGDTWWPERQHNKQGIISEVFYIFGFYPVIFKINSSSSTFDSVLERVL